MYKTWSSIFILTLQIHFILFKNWAEGEGKVTYPPYRILDRHCAQSGAQTPLYACINNTKIIKQSCKFQNSNNYRIYINVENIFSLF